MKIVISPAKTLDFTRALPTTTSTVPFFIEQAKQINQVLKMKSPKELAQLMEISPKLAQLNWERNQREGFGATAIGEEARQAIFAFNGDVYTGLDAYTLTQEQLRALQDKLSILSGLYGLLRPLDIIEPHRLEMGTILAIGEAKNLYGFWKTAVTQALQNELKRSDFLLNLASVEYFSVIDQRLLGVPVITPEFKEYKNGKLSVVSFFAKKARGLMTRFIIDQQVETKEQLILFNSERYAYDASLSTATKLVFTR